MHQTTMFDPPSPITLARTTDPATSHKAAAEAKVCESQVAVLGVLKAAGVPLTSMEIAERLAGQYSESRVRGALSELKRARSVKVVDENGRSEFGRACSRYATA